MYAPIGIINMINGICLDRVTFDISSFKCQGVIFKPPLYSGPEGPLRLKLQVNKAKVKILPWMPTVAQLVGIHHGCHDQTCWNSISQAPCQS